MKLLLVLAALAGIAQAFQPFTPVPSVGRSSAPAATTMVLGMGGGKGFSLRRFASNPFRPSSPVGKRGNRGSGNGMGGGGGGIPPNQPPKGPLESAASSDDSGKGSSAVGLWAMYTAALEKQPILTKAMTSFTGFALGDFLAQKFLSKSDEVDFKQVLRLAMFGFLIHGPTGHYFYNFLDSKIPGTAALTVASKVFIDQIIWNPIFGCMFFGYNGVTTGLRGAAIVDNIKNNLWASVKGSWTVWPVAHAINFRFIPTSQRLLYINSIQVGYNMFLSVLAKRATEPAPEPAKKGKAAKKSKA